MAVGAEPAARDGGVPAEPAARAGGLHAEPPPDQMAWEYFLAG